MAIEIRKVTEDKKGLEEFIRLPWMIYKDDPVWAPDLIMDLRKRVNKKKHPFFEFGDADFYIAVKDEEVVGRIAAIINPKHNDYYKDKTGFWGFFECVNDQQVANALFDTVRNQLKEKGRDVMRGPMSCDTQDEIGMLYEGFETHRFFIMPHNPLYYMDLCKNYGMEKAKDLIAFHIDVTSAIPERILSIANLVKEKYERKGYTFRNLNKKELKKDYHYCVSR